MILYSYTCIVSILAFVVAVQADTQQTLNSHELSLSLSNEQVTQYKYEKIIQSAAIENNQDNSVTKTINTEIVQKINSSNELDLNNVDTTDLNSALNVDVTDKLNELDSDSNGNHLSDNSFTNNYQSSNYYKYNIQNIADKNGGIPITAASSLGSNGPPSSVIPTSPNGNLDGVSSAASNVNDILSQSFMPLTYPIGASRNINVGAPTNLQTSNPSSNSGFPKTNLNGETPNTLTTSPGLNGSPSNAPSNSPYGELTDKLGSNGNLLTDNGFMRSYQSYYYGYNTQNDEDQNGGIPITAASSLGSNGPPSSVIPTSPNGNLDGVSSAASNVNDILSQPFMPLTYPIGASRNINVGAPTNPQTSNPSSNSGSPKTNQNGETPNTLTTSPSLNGSPSNAPSNSPYGELTDKLIGEVTDSNGNMLNDNSYLSSNFNGFLPNTANQESSYPYPPEMSVGLNNQMIPKSLLASSLQNTATPDQFSFYPGIPSSMLNGNSNDALSDEVVGWNPLTDMTGSPQTVDQTPTGTKYSSMDSETYRFLKYDNTGFELQNTDVGEVLKDGQLNIDDRYISDNYNDINNDRVNFPENGDVNNNFLYEKSSVHTAWSSDGDHDTQNDGNNVDGYYVAYDNGNLQEPYYESYIPNLNAGYENSEPFRGNTFIENVPYDNNFYPGNILYNYNNLDDIENDQIKIGIDELISENNQLSRTDFNTFSNNQISLTTDSYLDTDLSSDRPVYDFVDGDIIDTETIDSNEKGQLNENNVYDGQGFNGYNNMRSTNVPENNQLNKLKGDYTTIFEASSSNTETNADIEGLDGPQLLNSEYNLFTSSDLHKQSSDLNKQSSDLNNLLIDNVQLRKYLYRKTDTSNVNTLVESATEDNSNDFPTKAEDDRLKSIQNTVLSKNNALDVGQNVYDANGQVIGKIYKPSYGTAKTNTRHKYSGSSSYSSPSDNELSDDMHAAGHDIKRAARDAIGNVHGHIKNAYNTTKAVGKAAGNIVENAVSDAVDDIQETAKNVYHGFKDDVNAIENAVRNATNSVENTADNLY